MLARPAVRHAASACSTNSTGVGPFVVADQHGGMVGVELKVRAGALLTDAEEAVYGATAVGAGEPFVAGPELELSRLGAALTASRVANRVAMSTPLRSAVRCWSCDSSFDQARASERSPGSGACG
jgi:hypothetical protein